MFADDTAIMILHANLDFEILQYRLETISMWFKKSKIRVNEAKSIHVTLKRETYPYIFLNNIQVL